jgi:hypothetical protein
MGKLFWRLPWYDSPTACSCRAVTLWQPEKHYSKFAREMFPSNKSGRPENETTARGMLKTHMWFQIISPPTSYSKSPCLPQ